MSNNDNIQWTYDDDAGDKNCCGLGQWPTVFKAGSRQSPIDIYVHQDAVASALVRCCRGVTLQNNRKKQQHKHQQKQAEDNPANDDDDDNDNDNDINYSTAESSADSAGAGSDSASPEPSFDPYLKHNNRISHQQNDKRLKTKQDNKQNTRLAVSTKKIFLGYPRFATNITLTNTGHGWCATLPEELSTHTLLVGPPFGARTYKLLQFHAHWGLSNDAGSEHTINGRQFSAELHFVHWNCSQFKTPSEALKHKHGLAVLGVFVEAHEGDEHRNRHLDKIAKVMRSITEHKEETKIVAADEFWADEEANTNNNLSSAGKKFAPSGLDIKKLFPRNRWRYASYEGSLTTPPLSEVVDWTVFLEPIKCSTSQLAEFRKLSSSTQTSSGGKPLKRNWRPVQPHNGRQVTIWSHHH